MQFRQLAALAASVSVASAAIRGFNTGNTQLDGTPKQQSDFAAEFSNQRQLAGTDGAFTAARLYTMIQAGTTNSPISAIPAAIASNTNLLLGLWGSAGQDNFNLELQALKSAIQQYGPAFSKLVTGISVGSEDLYRITPIGVENGSPVGAGPDVISSFIKQAKAAIKGSSLAAAPVGHVDTWTAWVNGSNSAVIDACDFIGVNQFPYYQLQESNGIGNAKNLFNEALMNTRNAVGGKPVWVTETGWPFAGPKVGQAVANKANARTYWEEVYCQLPADVNLFWYAQRDGNAGDKATFGLSNDLSTTPAFDLSCNDIVMSSSSSSSASSTMPSTMHSTMHSATSTMHSSATTSKVTMPSSTGSGFSGNGSGLSGNGSGPSNATTSAGTESEPSSITVHSGTANHASATRGVDSTATAKSSAGVTFITSTVAGTGMAPSVVPTLAAGTGGVVVPSTTPMSFDGNGASSIRSTLGLLAIPALVAMML